MKKIVLRASIVCLIATALPFVPSDFWFFRIFDFPHVQIMALNALCLGFAAYYFSLKKKWEAVLIGLLVVSLAYQGKIIYPYTPIASCQVLQSDGGAEGSSLSMLSANVFQKNKKTEPLLATVEQFNPDIVLLLETDSRWQEQVAVLRKTYPHYVEHPLDNTYGMMLYSKLELLDPQVKYLVKDSIPSIHVRVRLRSGELVQLYAVHPEPPTPTESSKSTERDGELLMVGKMADQNSLPVIVVGDLNDVAWSSTTCLFQEVSGLLDPRKGRGFYNTFNANYPLLRWPLDHIFHSENFKLVNMARLDDINSDHFPIFIELSLEPEADEQQEEPQATDSQEEEATRKINKTKK